MATTGYIVEVRDRAGNRLGDGPITSLITASVKAAMDGAGDWSATFPVTDRRALELLQNERRVLIRDDNRTIVHGIIRNKQIQEADSNAVLQVNGPDILDELKRVNTLTGRIYEQRNLRVVLQDLFSLVPGWSFTIHSVLSSAIVDVRFDGVSVLAALQELYERYGMHLRLDPTGRRRVEIGFFGAASGYRVNKTEVLSPRLLQNPELLVVNRIESQSDSERVFNRLYLQGAGEGTSALDLSTSTRSSPYSIESTGNPDNTTSWYIEDSASIAQYGVIERLKQFKEIAALANTPEAIVAASNALYDAGAQYLDRHKQPLELYNLNVIEDDRAVLVGDKVNIDYKGQIEVSDGLADYLIVNGDYWVLESNESITADKRELRLKVGNIDRQEDTVARQVMKGIDLAERRDLKPAIATNVRTYVFDRFIEEDAETSFTLQISNSTRELQRMSMRVVTRPLVATSATNSSETILGTGDSGAVNTSTVIAVLGQDDEGAAAAVAPVTAENEDGLVTRGTSIMGSVDVGGIHPTRNPVRTDETDIDNLVVTGDEEAVGITGLAPLVTNAGGTASTGAANGGNTGAAGTGNTGAGGTQQTGPAGTGTTSSAGNHAHTVAVGNSGAGGEHAHTYAGGTTGGNNILSGITNQGHTHQVSPGPLGTTATTTVGNQSHRHTLANHTHSGPSGSTGNSTTHSHLIGNKVTGGSLTHTHGGPSHSHTGPSHTHSGPSHSHSTPNHSHPIAQHSHSIADHSHSVPAHEHNITVTGDLDHRHELTEYNELVNAHTHIIPAHTHEIANHTHVVPGHQHNIEPHNHGFLFGVFRDNVLPSGLRFFINGIDYTQQVFGVSSLAPDGGYLVADADTMALTDIMNNSVGLLRQYHTFGFLAGGGRGAIEVIAEIFEVTQSIELGHTPASINLSTDTGVAGAPNLQARGADSSVILTWNSVSFASSYDVRWKLTGDTSFTDRRGIASLGTTITGLANGSRYDFQVRASGGRWSRIVQATPMRGIAPPPFVPPPVPVAPDALAIPTGLALEFVGTGGSRRLRVTWNASAGATGYNLRIFGPGGAPIESGDVRIFTDTDVSFNAATDGAYTAAVRARDGNRVSGWSPTVRLDGGGTSTTTPTTSGIIDLPGYIGHAVGDFGPLENSSNPVAILEHKQFMPSVAQHSIRLRTFTPQRGLGVLGGITQFVTGTPQFSARIDTTQSLANRWVQNTQILLWYVRGSGIADETGFAYTLVTPSLSVTGRLTVGTTEFSLSAITRGVMAIVDVDTNSLLPVYQEFVRIARTII